MLLNISVFSLLSLAVITLSLLMSDKTMLSQYMRLFFWLLPIIAFVTVFKVAESKVGSSDAVAALSNAVFQGIGTQRPLLLLITVLFTGAFSFFLQTRIVFGKSRNNECVKNKTIPKIESGASWLQYCIAILLSVINFFPFISQQVNSFISIGSSLNFDTQNIQIWQYFFQNGLQPLKEYWYPYGYLMILSSGLFGLILFLAIWIYIIGAIIRITNCLTTNRFLAVTIVAIVLLLAQFDPYATTRYLFPVFAGMMSVRNMNKNRKWHPHLFILSGTIWLDPILAIFSLVVFPYLVMTVLRNKGSIKEILILFFHLSPLYIYIFRLISIGSLREFVNLYGDSKGTIQLVYSLDFGIPGPDSPIPDRTWASLLLIVVAMFIVTEIIQMGTKYRTSEFIVCALAILLVSFYVFYKDLVRGGMFVPLILYTFTLLLLFIEQRDIVARGQQNNRAKGLDDSYEKSTFWRGNFQNVAIGSTIAFLYFASGATIVSEIVSQRENLFSKSRVAITNISAIANEFGYFKRNYVSLNSLDPEIPELEKKYPKVAKTIQENGWYIFGNRPSLYAYSDANSDPYWTVSLWSNFRDTKKTLSQLIERNPRYIYVDKQQSTLNFDRITPALRNYELTKYIVENYGYLGSLKDGDILQKIREDQGISVEYWRSLYGETLNLGFSTDAGFWHCKNKNDVGCINVPVEPVTNSYRAIIQCPDGTYQVTGISSMKRVSINIKESWFFRFGCNYINS